MGKGLIFYICGIIAIHFSIVMSDFMCHCWRTTWHHFLSVFIKEIQLIVVLNPIVLNCC